MTDVSGNVVWAADYKPFGEATVTVSTITNNLRGIGQYADVETGLLYNYYRDLNPALGRYIEKDRIGLRGGINLYTFVGNNPLIFVDPLGLEVKLWGKPADLPFPLNQFDHYWIQTDKQESGMGQPNGDVPNNQTPVPFQDTQMVDHKGKHSDPAAHPINFNFPVDEDCVDSLIKPGTPTGKWSPSNQCQSKAMDVLEKCKIKGNPLGNDVKTLKPIIYAY